MFLTARARRLALLAAVAMACLPAVAQQPPKIPPRYTASPFEVAQLPKFCYHQYVDGSLAGEYSIPQSCGPEMNHFCPALVFMMKAQDVKERKSERVGNMGHARTEIQYTIRGMLPGCPIAPEVMAAKQRADLLSQFIK